MNMIVQNTGNDITITIYIYLSVKNKNTPAKLGCRYLYDSC